MEVMPTFAQELRVLLASSKKPELVRQRNLLELLSRCGCGDDSCSTFHTGGAAIASTLPLDPQMGILSVDLDNADRILCVEVLDRPDVELSLAIERVRSGGLGPAAG